MTPNEIREFYLDLLTRRLDAMDAGADLATVNGIEYDIDVTERLAESRGIDLTETEQRFRAANADQPE